MGDLISREAAINAVIKHLPLGYDYVLGVREAIEALPSAEPQKGKWVTISDGYVEMVKCDQCGKIADDISNFCPSCGADMRGVEND